MTVRARTLAGAAAAALACSSPPPQPPAPAVRPLTIRVLDGATGQPLANVPVDYALVTTVRRDRLFDLDPAIGPRTFLREAGSTDASGAVVFSARAPVLPRLERVREEWVLVNVRADPACPAARRELESLAATCRDVPAICSAGADRVDAAMELVWDAAAEQEACLSNPVTSLGGAILVTQPGESAEGYRNFSGPGGLYALRYVFGSLGKERDELVVRLPASGR